VRAERAARSGLAVGLGSVLDRGDRGLVGQRDRLGQQRGLHVVFEPVQVPGQPRGYLVDPPGRHLGAEQAVDHLGGALLAQLPEGVAQQRRADSLLRRSRSARRRSARVPGPSEDGGLEEF
jgi:hypothetical protein